MRGIRRLPDVHVSVVKPPSIEVQATALPVCASTAPGIHFNACCRSSCQTLKDVPKCTIHIGEESVLHGNEQLLGTKSVVGGSSTREEGGALADDKGTPLL